MEPVLVVDNIEYLWYLFNESLELGRCICSDHRPQRCTYDFSRQVIDANGERWNDPVTDHYYFYGVLRAWRTTRLDNLWLHFARWGHDGMNTLGGKAICHPTWKARWSG